MFNYSNTLMKKKWNLRLFIELSKKLQNSDLILNENYAQPFLLLFHFYRYAKTTRKLQLLS
jgi:hypothetical protein